MEKGNLTPTNQGLVTSEFYPAERNDAVSNSSDNRIHVTTIPIPRIVPLSEEQIQQCLQIGIAQMDEKRQVVQEQQQQQQQVGPTLSDDEARRIMGFFVHELREPSQLMNRGLFIDAADYLDVSSATAIYSLERALYHPETDEVAVRGFCTIWTKKTMAKNSFEYKTFVSKFIIIHHIV